MKIGILGGTFDPIHIGHLIIAEHARDQFSLDKVLLIPSGHSYFKDNRAQKVQPALVRYEMTALAAADNDGFEVSDMEVLRPGNSYTYETIEKIAQDNPGAELYYIVGADTVCSMHLWRYPERILANCTVLAAVRRDQVDDEALTQASGSLHEAYGAKIRQLAVPSLEISSTDIRRRAGEGHSIHYLVPDAVERYIIDNKIYAAAACATQIGHTAGDGTIEQKRAH